MLDKLSMGIGRQEYSMDKGSKWRRKADLAWISSMEMDCLLWLQGSTYSELVTRLYWIKERNENLRNRQCISDNLIKIPPKRTYYILLSQTNHASSVDTWNDFCILTPGYEPCFGFKDSWLLFLLPCGTCVVVTVRWFSGTRSERQYREVLGSCLASMLDRGKLPVGFRALWLAP